MTRVEGHLYRRQWCAEAWIFKPGERHRALRQGVRRVVYEQRAGEADGPSRTEIVSGGLVSKFSDSMDLHVR